MFKDRGPRSPRPRSVESLLPHCIPTPGTVGSLSPHRSVRAVQSTHSRNPFCPSARSCAQLIVISSTGCVPACTLVR